MSVPPPPSEPRPVPDVPSTEPSSRNSADAAWSATEHSPYGTHWEELLRKRARPRWGNFSWISPATLLDSINDQIARGIDDLVNARRMRWINTRRGMRRAAGAADPRIEWHMERNDLTDFRFAILGDPGEQDASQYAVVCPLLSQSTDARFMVVMSDVIYPAGDVNDYADGFYRPYEDFPGPVYALPGNHDWYDGLDGFMYHFCGAEPLPPTAYRRSSYTFSERVALRLWRRSARPDRAWLFRHGERRSTLQGEQRAPLQPGPYYVLETANVAFVAIDTGVTGTLDAEQGEWLCRVSAEIEKDKVLLTGKPLYVNGDYLPGEILWGDEETPPESGERRFCTVDDVVRAPEHRYVAAIGGDIHNYQRYRVRVGEPKGSRPDQEVGAPRTIQYIVAGGGGAYLSATHKIDRVNLVDGGSGPLPADVQPVTEDDFCCYPLRGDSLALFTHRLGRVIGRVLLAGIPSAIALGIAAFLWLWTLRFADGGPDQVAGWVAVSAPLLLAGAGAAVLAGRWLAGLVARPRAHETRHPHAGVARLLLTIACGALIVAGVEAVLDPWDWLWKVAAVTAGMVLLPLLAIVVSYVSRGAGPRIAGDVLLATVATGVPVWLLTRGTDRQVVGTALVVAAAAIAVLVVSRGSWAARQHARRWYKRILWLAVAAAIVAAIVLALVEPFDGSWIAQVLVAATAGIAVALLLLLAVVAWPAALAPWLFAFGRMDPDQGVMHMAEHLGTLPERVPRTTVDRSNRWRGKLLTGWQGRILNTLVSEAAEAVEPPFFKSFLTVDVSGGRLTIACWGVSGYLAQETAPTLEDRVEIPLS